MKLIIQRFKKYTDNDELMFKLSTALKFTLISAIFAFIAFSLSYLILRIDLVYFESYGLMTNAITAEAYFDYVFQSLWDLFPWIMLVFLIIFFGGYYIAIIMMRPFKVIGEHCEERMKQEKRFYQADFFSDLKLLTSFTSFFFEKIEEAKIKGKLTTVEIPEDFTKIHKPIIEKNFFLSYILLITIFGLLASVGILFLNNEIREQLFILANKMTSHKAQVRFFLERQAEVETLAIYGLLILHLTVNFIFGMHLYHKIASPSFAVFATLRSFLKGNYHNRIHLIGFYYLRSDCRKINKYLDYVQKELT